jgi:hypothetical protein
LAARRIAREGILVIRENRKMGNKDGYVDERCMLL